MTIIHETANQHGLASHVQLCEELVLKRFQRHNTRVCPTPTSPYNIIGELTPARHDEGEFEQRK